MDDFLSVYGDLIREKVHRVKKLYTSDLHFIDPAHEMRGTDALLGYFERLYAHVNDVGCEFHNPIGDRAAGYLQWSMRLSNPRVNRGGEVLVTGASFLKFSDDGKAYDHRDNYDLGAMLCGHLPAAGAGGGAIKKNRLGS